MPPYFCDGYLYPDPFDPSEPKLPEPDPDARPPRRDHPPGTDPYDIDYLLSITQSKTAAHKAAKQTPYGKIIWPDQRAELEARARDASLTASFSERDQGADAERPELTGSEASHHQGDEKMLRDSSPLSPTGGEGPGVRGSQAPDDSHTKGDETMLRDSSSPLPPVGEGPGVRGKKNRCTKAQARERRRQIRDWLETSHRPELVYEFAKTRYGIGRRQTQLYIQQVKKAQADEAGAEDYQAHMWNSKTRNDRLVNHCLRRAGEQKDARLELAFIRQAYLLGRESDKLMDKIVEHRVEYGRDTSPDAPIHKNRRNRIIAMPYDEWMERLDNLKHFWRVEWERAKFRWDFEQQMKRDGHPGHPTVEGEPFWGIWPDKPERPESIDPEIILND